jgi:hypothetical protein
MGGPENETRPLDATGLQNPSCLAADGGQSIRPEFSLQGSLAAAPARILFHLAILPDAAVLLIKGGRQ